MERVRAASRAPFGFGGLTVPERGAPVPCRLLMGEMIRLGCAFSFLRRSFHRDVRDVPVEDAVPRMRAALARAAARPPGDVARDRRALEGALLHAGQTLAG